jgi:hypothetical protein
VWYTDIRGLSPDDWSVWRFSVGAVRDPHRGEILMGINGTLRTIYYYTVVDPFGLGPRQRMGIVDPRTWEVRHSRFVPGEGPVRTAWDRDIQGLGGNGEWCICVSRSRRSDADGGGDAVRVTSLDPETLEDLNYRTEPGFTRGGSAYLPNLSVS